MKRIQQAIAVSGVVAALSYGALWLAYYQFYSRVQVLPEEVGIDKTDLLSQALVGPALLFFTFALSYGIMIVVMIVVTIVVTIVNLQTLREVMPAVVKWFRLRKAASPPTSTPRTQEPRWSMHEKAFLTRDSARKFLASTWRYTPLTAAAVAVLIFVVVAYALCEEASDRGRHLLNGHTITRPSFGLKGVTIPLLDIRATPVSVTWVATSRAPVSFDEGGDAGCLLYLGQAGGTTLLFDPPSGSVLRLPTDHAVFRLQPNDSYGEGCGPRTPTTSG